MEQATIEERLDALREAAANETDPERKFALQIEFRNLAMERDLAEETPFEPMPHEIRRIVQAAKELEAAMRWIHYIDLNADWVTDEWNVTCTCGFDGPRRTSRDEAIADGDAHHDENPEWPSWETKGNSRS